MRIIPFALSEVKVRSKKNLFINKCEIKKKSI